MVEFIEISVCSDCLVLIANGTDGHCVDCHDGTVCEATMRRIKNLGNDHYVPGDKEFGFSHGQCEGCKTVLSGDRFQAYVVDNG